MDDDEDEHQQPSTPFWLKNTTFQSSKNSRLTTFSSILFNSTLVILLLLLVAALIFIFFLIPSILDFTSQIFRPSSVKRSWDSLNLVLILFAVICAFLGKTTNNDIGNPNPNSASGSFRSTSPSPSPSYKFREREQQSYNEYSYPMTPIRSSSSYPDLRQREYTTSPISPWVTADYSDRSSRVTSVAYRFSDDTQLRSYHFSDPEVQISSKPSIESKDEIFVENAKPVEALPQDLSPPPPPSKLPFNPLPEINTRVKRKSTITYQAVERTEETIAKPNQAATVRRKAKRVHRSFDDAFDEQLQKPPSPPPRTAELDLNQKKKTGATKDFLTSLYGNEKRKKKRERQRSLDNFDLILLTRPTTAPPPPPPPPPSVFKNLFSTKKSKTKKSTSDRSDSIVSKSRSTQTNATTKSTPTQPPIPTQSTKSSSYSIQRGNESPSYGIPEPPPLPPFGMPVWKFVVEGDYVRLKSMNSSRSGSPDPEDESFKDSSASGGSMRSELDSDDGGESPSPSRRAETAAFCPSPDVDTKAENFIARFRAGLKMEKVNSGKGVGLSRLGPNTNIDYNRN